MKLNKTSEKIYVRDLGLMNYKDCWNLQHSLFDEMVRRKKSGVDSGQETLLLVEHPPVVTLGRHAVRENVLFSREDLLSRGVECFDIERGGDVTYHAPGQLVAYPIIDLERHHLGVKDYVELLEESVIKTIEEYGIEGERVTGASGVWIGKDTPRERKICAIGVKCSRFCTMHGLALNVNTDLSGFRLINPCGFIDKGVTSMEMEKQAPLDFGEVKRSFTKIFLELISR